jgi:hypothetical protein
MADYVAYMREKGNASKVLIAKSEGWRRLWKSSRKGNPVPGGINGSLCSCMLSGEKGNLFPENHTILLELCAIGVMGVSVT